MNRTLAIITVVSLFVAGIAVGALGMRVYSEHRESLHDGHFGPGHGGMTRRLFRELGLSDEQQERIEAILVRTHEKASELRRDLHPRVMHLMDRAHEEIGALLTPEQHEKFRRLIERNRSRAERLFLGGGRGRRPPAHRDGPPPPPPPRDPVEE